jgi:hypothetical protein
MAAIRQHLIKIIALTVLCSGFGTALRAQGDSLAITPTWYHGSRPWQEISREGRLDLLQKRRGYEAYQAKANERSSLPNASQARAGQALLNRIAAKYHLPSWYRTPDTFGSKMVIWIPEVEWASLTKGQRETLKSYMSSQFANWGIGVGRLHSREVYFDRLVVEN